jgi:hypothetical protein
MWCWRRMDKISWTDHVRNEEALLRIKEQRNILHEISKRKANWIGHILRRNCLLRRVIDGKVKGWIEVTGRRGRRRRKLLDDLKERRGYSYLKEDATDRTKWRVGFASSLRPVVRQTTKCVNQFQPVSNDTGWKSTAVDFQPVSCAAASKEWYTRWCVYNKDLLMMDSVMSETCWGDDVII